MDDLLDELERFSVAARLKMGIATQSPWGADKMARLGGVVAHYTVSEGLVGTVKWFCDASLNAKTSVHIVVGRGLESWHKDAAQAAHAPRIAALPATPVACRLMHQGAWHAAAVNHSHLGIELVGAGEVSRDMIGAWRLGPGGTGDRFRSTEPPLEYLGRFWQPQPYAQMATLVALCRAVRERAPDLSPACLVGHEHVQSKDCAAEVGVDKRDAGIGFPYEAWRSEVFSSGPIGFLPYPESRRAPLAYRINVEVPPQAPDVTWVQGMRLLGFAVPCNAVGGVDAASPVLRQSVLTLQTTLGLLADGQVGPKTIAAIGRRLVDRGFAPVRIV